jgi:uncharacterized protein (DUF1697 family)
MGDKPYSFFLQQPNTIDINYEIKKEVIIQMPKKIEKIKNILLKHYGKKNKITVREIEKLIGITKKDDTHAQVRKLILECTKVYKLPLAADNHGYYLTNNELEYNEYINNLNNRIKGIRERKEIITQNYKLTVGKI